MMKVIHGLLYFAFFLGCMQIADSAIWALKKIFKKVKTKDLVWKKIQWGIAATVFLLILWLNSNADFRTWLLYGRELEGVYGKLRLGMMYLAIIKTMRTGLKLEFKSREKRKGCELTKDEKFQSYSKAVFYGIYMALIITLSAGGLIFFFILMGIFLLACFLAKPITFIIKK